MSAHASRLATSNIPKLRLGLGRELLYKYSYLYKIFKLVTSNSMKCNQCSHQPAMPPHRQLNSLGWGFHGIAGGRILLRELVKE